MTSSHTAKTAETARILDGKATAAAIKAELTERVAALKAQGITPGLGTLLVGADPAAPGTSAASTRTAPRWASSRSAATCRPTTSQDELQAVVRELNENPECTGYIVQLPLPKHIDQDVILEVMDPDKDADGLHPMNLGRLVANVSGPMKSPLPCTPKGIVELLPRHGIDLNGKHVVVVGRGVTIGRPIGLLLTRKDVNATVILTHTGTVDLPAELRQADVVIAAAGQPHMIKAGDLKPGRDRARRRCHPGRRRQRQGRGHRRRGPRCGRRRRLALAEPRRSRPDDPRHAARQRGGNRGTPMGREKPLSRGTPLGTRLGACSRAVVGPGFRRAQPPQDSRTFHRRPA